MLDDDAIDLNEPAADESGAIKRDTTCRSCGYNLRGLSDGMSCPECGSPVADSPGPDPLHFAEPAWLVGMVRGTTMFSWATVGLVLAVLVTLPLHRLGGTMPTGLTIALSLVLLVVVLLLTACTVLSVWLMTGRESKPRPGDYRASLAWTARLGTTLGPGFAAIAAILARFINLPAGLDSAAPMLAYTLLGIGLVALLLHLRHLCDRLREKRLRRSTTLVAVGLGITFTIFVLMLGGVTLDAALGPNRPFVYLRALHIVLGVSGCAYLLGGLVFGTWMLVVIDRYRRTFASALKHQRRERRRRSRSDSEQEQS